MRDSDKLSEIALEYANNNKVFSCRMLSDHIFEKKIKFKKSMCVHRIGFYLSKNPLFKRTYVERQVQYYTLNDRT